MFLPDSLTIDDQTRTDLEQVLGSSADPAWRRRLSDATTAWLGGENDAFPKYVSFIRGVLS